MTSNEEVYEEDERPAIQPLPFYPTLCKVLTGATLALVVAYLEIHHPPANDATRSPAGPSSAPIYVDCDQMCAALGVNRRTLHMSFYSLAAWWRSEEARSGAARSGREFATPSHTRYGKYKPYSIVGSRDQRRNQVFTVRRNYGRINQILAQAGIGLWPEMLDHQVNPYRVEESVYATEETTRSLPDLLEKAVLLGVRNGWTEERRKAQGEKMRAIWEMRKKSGRADKPLDSM